MNPEPDSNAPTLYYDGACPVCAKEVSMYQRQKGACAVRWVDVARCSPQELGADLHRAQALQRLHFRLADGRLVHGVEAFAALWQTLPRWAWAGRLIGSRPMLFLLEPAYRGFLVLRRLWRREKVSPSGS